MADTAHAIARAAGLTLTSDGRRSWVLDRPGDVNPERIGLTFNLNGRGWSIWVYRDATRDDARPIASADTGWSYFGRSATLRGAVRRIVEVTR